MTIAKSKAGAEFLYKAETAHRVAKAHALEICEILNSISYDLEPGQTWYPHEVGRYDVAYTFAEDQRFVYHKNGSITRRGYRRPW